MAHYAWLDSNNKVINVSVGVDENQLIDGLDAETFYSQKTGFDIKRTSYTGKIRGNFASINFEYFPDFDIFMPPKCHDEAVINLKTAKWDCENFSHEALPL